MTEPKPQASSLRHRLYTIIFESDTPAGKAFDVALILAIVASVVVVMLDSIPSVRPATRARLATAEWTFTILFTIEYALRLWVVRRPGRYARSFFGLVDLFAILPTYFALLVPGARFLLVIRVLRVLRVFRILKLAHFVGEGQVLARAMLASRIMLFGYGMIAVPTGIMTVEIGNAARAARARRCPRCGREETDPEARFCRYCGTGL